MASSTVLLKTGVKGADQVSGAAKKVSKSWLDTAAKMTIVAQGLGFVFKKLGGLMAEPMKAAAIYAKDSAQLDSAIAKLGGNTQKTRAEFDAYALTMQRLAGTTLDSTTHAQKLWVQLTNNTDKANEATLAAQSMATALDIDANTAMRGLAQSMDGSVGLLGRYIPALRNMTKEQLKNGDAVAFVAEQFGDALTANMNTAIGQYERLNNIMGDSAEMYALAIMDNTALAAGLRQLGDDMMTLSPEFTNGADVVKKFVLVAIQALSSVGMVVGSVATAVQAVMGFLNKVVSVGLSPILAAIKGILGVVGSLGRFLGIDSELMTTFEMIGLTVHDIVRAPLTMGEAVEGIAGGVSSSTAMAIGLLDRLGGAIDSATAKTIPDKSKSQKEAAAASIAAAEAEKKALAKSVAAEAKAFAEKIKLHKTHMQELYDMREDDASVSLALAERVHADFIARQDEMIGSMRAAANVAAQFGNIIGASIGAAITKTKSLNEAMTDMALSMLDMSVKMVAQIATEGVIAAQVAAIHAGKSVSMIPVVGPVLAIAAAASVFAALMAYLKKGSGAKGMFFGGTLTGGIPGRDSIPIMARPDETYRSPIAEKALQQQLALGSGSHGGGGATNITISMMGTPSKAETRRFVLDTLLPEMRSLQAMGY